MSDPQTGTQPQHPSDAATRDLAKNDRWPWPPLARKLGRVILGRPSQSPLDDGTLRADVDRAGIRAGNCYEAGQPMPAPEPGLVSVMCRVRMRAIRRASRAAKKIGDALVPATKAQAILDRLQLALAQIATRRDSLEQAPPTRPNSPLTLAGGTRHLALALLLFVPLEAYLTYPTLQVLNMSNADTRRLCVLVGIAFAIVAGFTGALLGHVIQHGHRSNEHRNGLMLGTFAALIIGVVIAGVWTFDAALAARETNASIVNSLTSQANETTASAQGFGGLSAASAPPGAGLTSTTGYAPSVASGAASATPNLGWTFPLQVFAFLAAIGLGACRELAADYNQAMKELRRAQRREWWLAHRVARAETRVARRSRKLHNARSRHLLDSAEDQAFGESLMARGQERFGERLAERGLPPRQLPTPAALDLAMLHQLVLDPELDGTLPAPSQVAVGRVPTGRHDAPPPGDPCSPQQPSLPLEPPVEANPEEHPAPQPEPSHDGGPTGGGAQPTDPPVGFAWNGSARAPQPFAAPPTATPALTSAAPTSGADAHGAYTPFTAPTPSVLFDLANDLTKAADATSASDTGLPVTGSTNETDMAQND